MRNLRDLRTQFADAIKTALGADSANYIVKATDGTGNRTYTLIGPRDEVALRHATLTRNGWTILTYGIYKEDTK